MASHRRIFVEPDPTAKRDPRKIDVQPGTGPVPPPAVRGMRLRSVLRDQVRSLAAKAIGDLKARALTLLRNSAAGIGVLSDGFHVEPEIEVNPFVPGGVIVPVNILADVTVVEVGPVGITGKPGKTGPAGPPAPVAKKPLTKAEREQMLADARAKKQAGKDAKAGKGASTKPRTH